MLTRHASRPFNQKITKCLQSPTWFAGDSYSSGKWVQLRRGLPYPPFVLPQDAVLVPEATWCVGAPTPVFLGVGGWRGEGTTLRMCHLH